MLKKAGAVAAAAAGFLMMGAPAAMAGEGHDGHEWENGPLLVVGNANNLNGVLGGCGNNVGVFGGIEDGDDLSYEG